MLHKLESMCKIGGVASEKAHTVTGEDYIVLKR